MQGLAMRRFIVLIPFINQVVVVMKMSSILVHVPYKAIPHKNCHMNLSTLKD